MKSHQLRRQLSIDSNLSKIDFQITLSRSSRSPGDPNASRRLHHTWYSKPWLPLMPAHLPQTNSPPPRILHLHPCLLKFVGYPRTSSNLSSRKKILPPLRWQKSHMELQGASKFPPSASTNMQTQSSTKQPYKPTHFQWTAHSPHNIGWCQLTAEHNSAREDGLITWHAVG